MFRTIKDINIPAGALCKEVDDAFVCVEDVFLRRHLVEEIVEDVEETEPGWKPISQMPPYKPVLVLSKGSRVPIPYIGLKNTEGKIVLRDHAGTIPNPAGWREI